jgi:aquaporin NIP
MNKNFIKQMIAEFIGTYFLVFFGCGAVIVMQKFTGVPPFIIPVAFGGVVSVMIYATGHISGAHFNPAVTIAFAVARHFPITKVIGYIIAQVSAAILASWSHALFFTYEGHGFGVTSFAISPGLGFGFEFLLSFILMFVIIAVATDTRAKGEMAGLAIGTTVGICAAMGGPVSGASMNPARSIGPALLATNYTDLWIYCVAPILGAACAAIIYEKIRCNDEDPASGAKGCC